MNLILPPTRTEPIDSEKAILWRSRSPAARRTGARKYSVELLDIAARMAIEKNTTYAEQKTGVSRWSIKKHLARKHKDGTLPMRRRPRKDGMAPCCRPKYNPRQIEAMLKASLREYAANPWKTLPSIVRQTAKAYNLPGAYIWSRVMAGHVPLPII
jgi:hypothetical protein